MEKFDTCTVIRYHIRMVRQKRIRNPVALSFLVLLLSLVGCEDFWEGWEVTTVTDTTTVYITVVSNDTHYHKNTDCDAAKGPLRPITKSEAKNKGKSRCPTCKP